MVMVMRMAGNDEDKDSKATATSTKVVGKRTAMVRATKKSMATKTRFGGAGGGNDCPLRAS